MSLKSLIQKLDQLNEGIMDEPSTKETPTGRIHQAKPGGYGRKDDEDTSGKKIKPSTAPKGRGRPKKNADSDTGEVTTWDASALNSVFGGKKPKTLPGKASVKHKIKDDNAEDIDEDLDPEQKKVGQLGPYDKVGKKGAVGKLVGANESVAEAEKNPHTSALGKALYRDLSKEKKASPQQVQRNKERWAKRQAEREQGVTEGYDNPLKDIDPNAWHLIQGDRPIAINFPDEYRAKSFHSGHGYGRETKVLHGSQVRQNAYLKHNPGVINYPEYSKGVAEGFSDVVKGIKRKLAGKQDPKEVEYQHGFRARQAIDASRKYNHQAAYDNEDKMVDRYNKVHKVVNKGVSEGSLNESPSYDTIRGLITEFNKQMSGSPYYPLDYKSPGMRMWTRGDGSKYKDPGYIFIDRDLKPEDQPKWREAGAVEKFWKFLESKGARKIGDVSGEFGSSPHSPAVVLNKIVFVIDGNSIAWGSTSRLKNTSVWRQKQQGVAEAGNKPVEKSYFGMGDDRTPRELKTQMSGASDEFVNRAAKEVGPFHSKVAKMQGKLAKSELRKREQGVAEGYRYGKAPWVKVIVRTDYDYDPEQVRKLPLEYRAQGWGNDGQGQLIAFASKKDAAYFILKVGGEVVKTFANSLNDRLGRQESVEQGVAEGLSKRDQKDVDAIKAAIAGLEDKLKQPNADKEKIKQTIANEKKRLALYGKDLAEGKKDAHEDNMDAAQKEMDRREAEGEDMTGAKIDPKTYKITKPKQDVKEGEKVKTKSGTIHKGTYGYGDEKDEITAPKGRGRPKKDTTADGEGGPKFNDAAKSFFGVGNIAYKDLPGKPGKKHKLKDWIEYIESNIITEASLDPSQVAIASVKAPGSTTPTANSMSSTTTQPVSQTGTMATSASTAKPAMGATVLDFKNPNDPLKAAIQQAVKNKQVTALGEEDVDEVITKATPAGEIIGDFQKSKNSKFAGKSKEERKRMALGAYYGMHPEKSKKEESVMESIDEGHMSEKLKDLLDNYPYEHNNAQQGWGLHENFYQALCDHYWKEGKIPRDIMYGAPERLREFVEECYGSDTGILNENPLLSMAAGAAGTAIGSAVADKMLGDSVQDPLARFGDEDPEMPPLSPADADYSKPTHEIPAFVRKSWEKGVTPTLPEDANLMDEINQMEEDYMSESKKAVGVKDAQMESWDKQLSAMLAEGLTITTTTDNDGHDGASVNATDADAQTLIQLLQNSGLMKGQNSSMNTQSADTGNATVTVEPVSADEVMGTLQPEVSGSEEGDDALGFLKRMLGAREEHSGTNTTDDSDQGDYEEEDGETCDTCGHEDCECDHEESEEEVEEGNAFSGAVAKAKADGIQKGETVTVGGKKYPVKEENKQDVAEDIAGTRREVNLKKKVDNGTATPEQKKEYEELKAKNMGGKPYKKQEVAEGLGDAQSDAMAGLQRTIDFAKQEGYKVRRSPTGSSMQFIHPGLDHKIVAQVKNDGDSINVHFMDYSSGVSGNDDASYFDQVFKDAYKKAVDNSSRFSSDDVRFGHNSVAEGLGDDFESMLAGMKNKDGSPKYPNAKLRTGPQERKPVSNQRTTLTPKTTTKTSDPYSEYSDDYGVYKQGRREQGLDESAKLDEWANSVNDSDEKFLADMTFMTKTISGGLNNIKQDQTVVPSARVKTQGETKQPDLTMAEMIRKLTNIN